MSYLTMIDDETAEIDRLTRQRENYDPTDEQQVLDRDAVDSRIAVLTARRDALRASIPALEELNRGITAAVEERKESAEDLRNYIRESLRSDWPAFVLLAAVITAQVYGVNLFPTSWWGTLASYLAAFVGGCCTADVLFTIVFIVKFVSVVRDHRRLIAERDRTMAEIDAGRPAQAVNW
jgi:hypothetical protein